jgi:hypothetical protein
LAARTNDDKPHKLVLFATFPARINPLLAGNGVRHVMTCRLCGSKSQEEYGAEINIHIPTGGDKAAVLLFPKLVVCLDCGVAEFTVPEAELRQLGKRGAASTAA